MSILKASFLVLGNMKAACLDEYSSKSEGYIKIKKEIKNLEIPSTKDDRENLQRDRNKAANDLKTALEKELCNG
ncbi:hypothetical protein HZQ94_18925 [Elizabethkingia anophelis]|nr:hypothetical protein [Elizabethkingia anophelis]MCT3682733.1 hypothetical protein [Elizabethkingia anophelis]